MSLFSFCFLLSQLSLFATPNIQGHAILEVLISQPIATTFPNDLASVYFQVHLFHYKTQDLVAPQMVAIPLEVEPNQGESIAIIMVVNSKLVGVFIVQVIVPKWADQVGVITNTIEVHIVAILFEQVLADNVHSRIAEEKGFVKFELIFKLPLMLPINPTFAELVVTKTSHTYLMSTGFIDGSLVLYLLQFQDVNACLVHLEVLVASFEPLGHLHQRFAIHEDYGQYFNGFQQPSKHAYFVCGSNFME